jgi:hypothetical protein
MASLIPSTYLTTFDNSGKVVSGPLLLLPGRHYLSPVDLWLAAWCVGKAQPELQDEAPGS